MDYVREAINIQEEIICLIEKEDFNRIQDVLDKRKSFYLEFAEKNPSELQIFLKSKEYNDYDQKINKLFIEKKAEIKNELEKLKLSKKATKGYQNNIFRRDMFFNKKI